MNSLIRQITALSVLWTVCELLLPEGKYQPMVRMTASLLVMTALMTTIAGWLGHALQDVPAITLAVQQASENAYQRTALTAAANQLENWCVRMAEKAGYQASAAVYLTLDGALDHVQMAVRPSEHPLMTTERLAGVLAEQLGVSREQILLSEEAA